MRKIFGIVSLAILFSACTEFFAEMDTDTGWKLSVNGPIKLHYKEPAASNAPSPTTDQVESIIENQNHYYQAIQDSIQKRFTEPILIYLYNKDQAKDEIGTSGGGLSQSKYMSIYYTFIHDIAPYTDQYGIVNPFVGAHEMVHIITHNVLGHPGTKMMSEGYAVWLDGSYGRKDIDEYVRTFKKDYPEYLLTPTQLLNESMDIEKVYYPNAGIFIRFLVKEYGIDKANQLFSISKGNFKTAFQNIMNNSWNEMSTKYRSFLNKL